MNEREVFSLLLVKSLAISNKIKNEIFALYSINDFISTNSEEIVKSISSFKKGQKKENIFTIEQFKDTLVKSMSDVKKNIKEYKNEKTKLFHFQSKRYPKNLLDIPDKPLLLFIKGRIPKLFKSIAIIGTREPTPYGEEIAYNIGKYLSGKGFVIISGLAKGIDTRAHQGALDGGGKTIAVLGTPVNKISPRNNVKLAQNISKKGAIISEFDNERITKREDFVKRNRITVGLAQVVIVIETKISGGSISSIRYADRFNKPILIPRLDIWKVQTKEYEKSLQISEALELLKSKLIIFQEKKQKLKTEVVEIDISNFENILSVLKEIQEKKSIKINSQKQKKLTDFQ